MAFKLIEINLYVLMKVFCQDLLAHIIEFMCEEPSLSCQVEEILNASCVFGIIILYRKIFEPMLNEKYLNS